VINEDFTSWLDRMISDPPKELADEFNILGSPLSRARELALLVLEGDASHAYRAFYALRESGEASDEQLKEAFALYTEALDKTYSSSKLNLADCESIIEKAELHKLSKDALGNAMRNGL
jgi:hypothetical protein